MKGDIMIGKFNKYELIGFVNILNIIPDFVYPVFEYQNKFYLQTVVNNTIVDFYELKSTYYKRIIYVNNCNLIFNKKEYHNYYCKDMNPVYAFQVSSNEIFYSEFDGFYTFINDFKTTDFILYEDIQYFLMNNSDIRINRLFT